MPSNTPDFSWMVGLTTTEAATQTPFRIRIVARANKRLVYTADYNPSRVNVAVDENDKIVEVRGLG